MRKKTQYSNTPASQSGLFPADKPARTGLPWIGLWCTTWNAGDGARRAERQRDGPIDAKYPLKETPSASYLQRTEWNVRDSDATVLFSVAPILSGGSKKTVEFAGKHKKPYLHLCADDEAAADKLKAFIDVHGVKVLNVAGPRASNELGVGEFVMRTLEKAFSGRLR